VAGLSKSKHDLILRVILFTGISNQIGKQLLEKNMARALIVEDELDLCNLLSIHLKNLGIENEFVGTIEGANLRLKEDSFNLVLLDLNLSDGSGFEVLDFIKSQDKPRKVIVVSAYDGERKKALNLGANFFLAKPFTKKSIELAVQQVLS
jgi:DNA-binding response OmpR family regulator